MTQSFFASLEAAGQLIEDEMEAVFRGAVQDTSELMTRRQASVKETGGAFEIGKVPVDEGELINSQETRLNGAKIGEGEAAYEAFIEMDVGDIAEHVFTAPHARPMEYGFRYGADDTDDGTGDVDVPGRFFVSNAVQSWSEIVDANARHIKE